MPTPARTLNLWIVASLIALSVVITVAPARAQCVGDCNGDGMVSIDELITGVNIALGNQPISACPAFDCDGSGTVPIQCLIQAVNNALDGCPGGNCPLAAGSYTVTQTAGSMLTVSDATPFAFPAGGTIVEDVSAGDANCIHNVVVPFPGGIDVPAFCFPAFGFSVKLTQTGCGIGQIASKGGADYTISEIGDTSSQPICNNQQECTNGVDSKVRVDVTVGNGMADTCPANAANSVVTIPVHTVSWLDLTNNPPQCPSSEFHPGTDLLVLDVTQILDLTTDTNKAQWSDLSGDGCPIAGRGPAAGLSSTGACWDLSANTVGLAASGAIGSQNTPLFDFTFTAMLLNAVSVPNPPLGATCEAPPPIDFTGSVTRCLE